MEGFFVERFGYLALGDSITVGRGASTRDRAYVKQIYTHLTRKSAANRMLVVAKEGWTSTHLLHAVQQLSPTVWKQTNVVTVLTGGNDVRKLLRGFLVHHYFPMVESPLNDTSLAPILQNFSNNIRQLCQTIRLHGVPHVFLFGLYNPAPNYPFAVRAIGAINECVTTVGEEFDFPCLALDRGFDKRSAEFIEGYRHGVLEDLVSPMGRPIHPTDAGHAHIAKIFTEQFDQRASLDKTKHVTQLRSSGKTKHQKQQSSSFPNLPLGKTQGQTSVH